jgi:hypothetical protein
VGYEMKCKANNNNNNNNNNNKQRMWNVKTKLAIEETGTISKSFRKYLSNIWESRHQGTT